MPNVLACPHALDVIIDKSPNCFLGYGYLTLWKYFFV